MNEIVTQTVEWLGSSGAPNGLLLLAILTRPTTWSKRAVRYVDRHLPGSEESGSTSSSSD